MFDASMRTTLTIDDDVLAAAKALADQERRSLGEVISELARRSLHRPAPREDRNGIPQLAHRSQGKLVTLEMVNALRDELP
jgi:hypothetical protein